MFVACGIWCLADGSNVSPLSEQAEGLTDCGGISVEIVGIYIMRIKKQVLLLVEISSI